MIKKITQKFLTHPLELGADIDDPETSISRSKTIQRKVFLKKIYEEWYAFILKSLPLTVVGPVLEIGSGGGFIRKFIHEIITSDIIKIPDIDVVLDAQHIPFGDADLRSIVMIDVFHHLPQVRSFLTEAGRCVKSGGSVIMIEPWVTNWSKCIYKYLHHEPFKPHCRKWSFSTGGPLSHANTALPWIVFKRDRQRFEREFPEWLISKIHLHAPFRYILSGGVSLRSLMPGNMFPIWCKIEELLKSRMEFWAMFAGIALNRK